VAGRTPGEDWQRALQRAVWLEKVRIALREVLPPKLGGAELPETARELAELADAVMEVAVDEATAHVAGRRGAPRHGDGSAAKLCVLGMGKLGGLELNAGSDIDVVFVYDSDDAEGELTPHDFFTRVVRRAVSHIEATAPEGMIFRVDLRLRPEGSQGALVNSLSAFERYYETWGRLWERAAMLRARPVAGDVSLGAALDREVISPFVYRREVDPNIAEGLTDLVLRSRAELSPNPARDLKLGPGGIREAEFFVQTLQLIWGGQEPSLRVRGTLNALERLRLRGFVTDREARDIARGYVLLRRAEHAIQWSTGIQTHLMPTEERDRERLARTLGYADAATFEAELGSLRVSVGEAFASLTPGTRRDRPRHGNLVAWLREGDASAPEALGRAAQRLFASTEVPDHLRALARRPDGLLGAITQEQHADLADRVLVVVGGPFEQLQIGSTQQWHRVDHCRHIAQLACRQRGGRNLPHQDAHELLPAEGHVHAGARLRTGKLRGQPVVEQPSQRCIERNLAEAILCDQAKLRATLPKCLPACMWRNASGASVPANTLSTTGLMPATSTKRTRSSCICRLPT
jgi:glutamate-ammonia-ligase adenylyltransferase